jgi:Tol biopolymer transport system component
MRGEGVTDGEDRADVRDRGRALRRRWVGTFCVCVGGLLLWSAPALALSQRGHVFGFAFGAEGTGNGQLMKPSGIAVNESSGQVYVGDSANNRVELFGPKGEFVAVWGWGVSDGKEEYETCRSPSVCRPGIAGFGKKQFDSPAAIAVDNSHAAHPSEDPSAEDVYVVASGASGHGVIDKFAKNGEFISQVTSPAEAKESEGISGVAVDSQGLVWVDSEFAGSAEIASFSDAAVNEPLHASIETNVEVPRAGFAVDSKGGLYVTGEREGKTAQERKEEEQERKTLEAKLKAVKKKLEEKRGNEGELKEQQKTLEHEIEEKREEEEEAPCANIRCVTAKLDGSGTTLIESLDQENTTGVAVDLRNDDVYLDNVTSVAALSSSGSLIQRFGAGALQHGSGVAVDSRTETVYVADSLADQVDVFTPEPPGPPTVEPESVGAANVTATSADLGAQIDPIGADTHYHFQFGTVGCASSPSACTDLPAADVGEGFGDQAAGTHVSSLNPSTTYYFRVLAENGFTRESGAVVSEERSFTTQPAAGAFALADSREWEMVSPPNKDGGSIEPITFGGGLIQASEDGSAITYVADAPLGERPAGSRGPEPAQIASTRGEREWSSQDIATPNTKSSGYSAGANIEYQFFSANLSTALVEPFGLTPLAEPPLSPALSPQEEGHQEKTIYLRDSASGGYLPLVTAVSDTAKTAFGLQLKFAGATPDLGHVVVQSKVALTSQNAASGENLYEWTAGKAPEEQLQLVSVLPNGQPAKTAALGDSKGRMATRHAISKDGSRVFWSNGGGTAHLYMRDTQKGQTVQLDAAQGIVEPEQAAAEFQLASGDGSKVFFTDQQRLTAEANASFGEPDLYECELVETEGKLECKLTDLTPHVGESASVLGVLPGASEDGSYVYFVANAVLATGAAAGNCGANGDPSPPGATCNLYVWHNGRTTFIARLSGEDRPDWQLTPSALEVVTSRVSPNGRYLAFMSARRLTGYDNRDANSGVSDEEVYLYDVSSGRLVCASCNPTGARPVGVLDTKDSGEGLGLVVDRRGTWESENLGVDHWLAGSVPGWIGSGSFPSLAQHQPRYLSDSGRLFFNSNDALVTQDTNGKEDVYEYEPSGEGSCHRENGCLALMSGGTSAQESAFLDASASGNDVFFVTTAKLAPQDADTNFDVYVARVCGTSETLPCLPPSSTSPPPCRGEACRAAQSPQASFGPPASATLSGSGNVAQQLGVLPFKAVARKPLTRAQKLAKALKACKKKNKSKRVACVKQARKKYGPKKPKAKKGSSRRRRRHGGVGR